MNDSSVTQVRAAQKRGKWLYVASLADGTEVPLRYSKRFSPFAHQFNRPISNQHMDPGLRAHFLYSDSSINPLLAVPGNSVAHAEGLYVACFNVVKVM